MDIKVLGPWLMLGVGLIVILAAVGIAVFKKNPPSFLMWVFGVALMGVGSYGPIFLDPYKDFLDVLAQVSSSPSAKTQEKLLSKIGTTNLPPKYRQLGLDVVLQNPVPETGQLISTAIDGATNAEGKKSLKSAEIKFNKRVESSANLLSILNEKDLLNENTISKLKLDKNAKTIFGYVRELPDLKSKYKIEKTKLDSVKLLPIR